MANGTKRNVTRLVAVEGFVQGVGYREFTRRAAERLGVFGWVRNRLDGTVEALLHGPAEAVEALSAEMRRGPSFATVTEIRVLSDDAAESFVVGAFVVRTTR
jgi:acylphosphatase